MRHPLVFMMNAYTLLELGETRLQSKTRAVKRIIVFTCDGEYKDLYLISEVTSFEAASGVITHLSHTDSKRNVFAQVEWLQARHQLSIEPLRLLMLRPPWKKLMQQKRPHLSAHEGWGRFCFEASAGGLGPRRVKTGWP